jgi:REP element-mobilizing transposase RayT
MSDEKFQNKYRIPSARAAWHDYNGGIYFITICTKNRENYFGEIENGMMQLSEIGKYAFENLQNINTHYPYAEIPLFVVMPNHIHGIVFIDGDDTPYVRRDTTVAPIVETRRATSLQQQEKNEQMQKIANRQSWLAVAIGGIKSAETKFAHNNNIDFAWQTRFHDHIVRDQDEINRIADYIENNPATWDTDCFNQSPFEVSGIDTNITTEELVEILKQSRSRSK